MVRRYHLDYLSGEAFATHPHHMHLHGITLEGRCTPSSASNDGNATEVLEFGNEYVLPFTSCPKLPETTFDYSQAAPVARVVRTGGFSGFTHSAPNGTCTSDADGKCICPDNTLASPSTCIQVNDTTVTCACAVSDGTRDELKAGTFLDINGDALPDFVGEAIRPRTTQPVCLNNGHDSFDCRYDIAIRKAGVVATSVLPGAQVTPGDFVGDGKINLLRQSGAPVPDMPDSLSDPLLETYSVYSPAAPSRGSFSFEWVESATGSWSSRPDNASKSHPQIEEQVIGASDLNGDGLTDQLVYWSDPDVLDSAATASPAYGIAFSKAREADILAFGRPLAPARVPHVPSELDALFLDTLPIWMVLQRQGSARATARARAHKAPMKTAPFQLADMNGDGVTDVVGLRDDNSIRYWAGAGDGTFGDVSCAPKSVPYNDTQTATLMNCSSSATDFGQALTGGPGVDPGDVRVLFHDVNGDGLADMIVVRAQGIEVFANFDGSELKLITEQSPDALGDLWSGPATTKIDFADMDGSGVDDIVLTDTAVGYIDVVSGAKAGLLTTIQNGVGAVTTVEYASIAQLDTASLVGHWTQHTPQSTHVVTRITTRNGLSGSHGVARAAEYTYAEPIYEPRSHQYRGFRHVTVVTPADEVSPGTRTERTYLIGQCPQDGSERCSNADDNPWDALRGLTSVTDVGDAAGNAWFSTTHTDYQVRRMAQGSDNRWVRIVFAEQTDTYLYAPTSGPHGVVTPTLQDVDPTADLDGHLASESKLLLHNGSGMVHLRKTASLDQAGRVVKTVDYGRVEPVADPVIVSTQDWYVPQDAVFFLSRVQATHVGAGDASGNLTGDVRTETFTHDPAGNVTNVYAELKGTAALSRSGGIAVPPTASAASGTVLLAHVDVDPVYGTALRRVRPNDRVETFLYDAVFHQLILSKTIQTGTAATGYESLSSGATYDRGLGRPITAVAANGASRTFTYDGFGRLTDTTKPATDGGGVVASEHTDYLAAVAGIRRVHVHVADGSPTGRDAWALIDSFGNRLATMKQADPAAGDGASWVVAGQSDLSATGKIAREYVASFWSGDPVSGIPLPTARGSIAFAYDGLGRTIATTGVDGTPMFATTYHALSEDLFDAENLSGGIHANTPTTVAHDGHGRKLAVTERSVQPTPSSITTTSTYLPTGELAQVTRSYDAGNRLFPALQATYVRTMAYDSLGRMVQNIEPNTSLADGQGMIKSWRYAYDDAGDLVATEDARGCGENIYYEAAGRKLAEDFIPCTPSQAAYTAPDLVSGNGTEAFYRYDAPDAALSAPGVSVDLWKGHLASIRDRAAYTRLAYDARGRLVRTSRALAKPGMPEPALDARYSAWSFDQVSTYDEADRLRTQTTGADVVELLEGGASTMTREYTGRGLLKSVTSSYGVLLTGLTYDEDGSALTSTLGDAAATTTALQYTFETQKRLRREVISRATPPPAWASPPAGYTSPTEVTQAVLSDTTSHYDRVGNPVSVSDAANAAAWPGGAKPVSHTMEYDDRYRLVRTTYGTGDDTFVDPMPALGVPSAATSLRPKWQTYHYDGAGNTTGTGDDAALFYDRSLGDITNGADASGPNQFKATGIGARGSVNATYDAAGNMTKLVVQRPGPCVGGGTRCQAQEFDYDWDEVGQLARARRLDGAQSAADLTYSYDASGARVLTARATGPQLTMLGPAGMFGFGGFGSPQGSVTYNAEIFGTLRLHGAAWDPTSRTYERTATTEVVYLGSIGRLVYAKDDLPSLTSGKRHIFFTVGDRLGSTSFVIDKETSEVVERRTYQAYGAVESDYRAERWKGFREIYGFTGKEDDVEVGLTYFGARYYAPAIGRWISPDPLTIHSLRADGNPYAYVGGRVYAATDPTGLRWMASVTGYTLGYGGDVPSFAIDSGACDHDLPHCDSGTWAGVADGASAHPEVNFAIAAAGPAAVGAEVAAYFVLPALAFVILDCGLNKCNATHAVIDGIQDLISTESIIDTPDNNPPFRGVPGSIVRGGVKSRSYGPDGYPQTDRDLPHPDEAGTGSQDHVHDWGRPANGGPPTAEDRGTSRTPMSDDPPLPRGPNVPPP